MERVSQHPYSTCGTCTHKDSLSCSNLGALSRLAQPETPPLQTLEETLPPAPLDLSGVYIDPAAIVGSSLLLIILLALTFERVLGLDKVSWGLGILPNPQHGKATLC